MARDDSRLLVRLISRALGGLVALIVVVWVFSGTIVTVQADEIVIKQDLLAVSSTCGTHQGPAPFSGER